MSNYARIMMLKNRPFNNLKQRKLKNMNDFIVNQKVFNRNGLQSIIFDVYIKPHKNLKTLL